MGVEAGADCLGEGKTFTVSESRLTFAGNYGGLDNFQQGLRVNTRWRTEHFAVYKLRYIYM